MNIHQYHILERVANTRLNPQNQWPFSGSYLAIGLAAVLLAAMPTPSSALTLVVNNDTMVDSDTLTTQYGSSDVLGIRNVGSTQRTFAKFDLTALPQNAVITQATLRVFIKQVLAPGELTVNTVSADWSERTLSDSVNLNLVPLASTLLINPKDSNHYVNYDMTALVQSWQSKAKPNFGIAITPPAVGSPVNVLLDSKESNSTSHPMEIEVAFEGARGVQGDKGDTGIQGLKGDTGATGSQGLEGPQGLAGLDGKDGVPGQQGLPGLPGPAGAMGPQGIPGAQGPTGGPGAQGPAGANRITGYEKILVTSKLNAGYEQVKLDAFCHRGKKVLGGGCDIPSLDLLVGVDSSEPIADNGYSCYFSNVSGFVMEIRTYAICAYVP